MNSKIILRLFILVFAFASCQESQFYDESGKLVKRTFNDEGKIITEQTFKNDDIPSGYFKQFYPSGKLEFEITYKDGIKEGETKSYYEDGKLKFEGYYKNNHLDSVYSMYYETGELKLIGYSKEGKAFGKELSYYKSGKLKCYSFFYANGNQIYKRCYNENEDILEEEGSLYPLVIFDGKPELKEGESLNADIFLNHPPGYEISLYVGYGEEDEWNNVNWEELKQTDELTVRYTKVFNKAGIYHWKLKLKYIDTEQKREEQEIMKGVIIEVK